LINLSFASFAQFFLSLIPRRLFLINPYFLIFECLIYTLFLGSVYHAHRRGYYRLLELIGAGLYGLLLEWLTIKQLHAYHYGEFMIMIDGAPLCIGLGWAVILYSGMEFSDQIQLPDSVRPILDALMALNIDLALDAIAVRLGMWSWAGVTLNQQWFGVPWVNFAAWFIIVWSYSGFIRALRSWQGQRWQRWCYIPLAILLSLCALTATSEAYRIMAADLPIGAFPILVLVMGSCLIILSYRPHSLPAGLPEPVIIAVPLLFHVFAILVGFTTNSFAQQPILAVSGFVMLGIGLIAHLLPWWFGRDTRLR
jgi:hypothetical protein